MTMQCAIVNSTGWLSPEGKYYPCQSWEHSRLAVDLTQLHYNAIDGDDLLMLHGWARIAETYVFHNRSPLTQRQVDSLFDLFTVATGYLKYNVGRFCEIRDIPMPANWQAACECKRK